MKHRVYRILAVIIAALSVVPAGARADTIRIEARGQSDTRDAAEPAAARTRALDAAFAAALEQALAELIAPAVRARHQREIGTEVLRRARLFIASYKVLEEGEIEGQRVVRITATVDLDKLRDKLAERGIEAAAEPGEVAEESAPASRARPKVVVLLHAVVGETTATTFGQRGDDGGVPGRTLIQNLREQGFEVLSAAGAAAPVSREAPQGVPLDDAAAGIMARQAGAGGAFVLGLQALPDGLIRGTRLVGAQARAVVRVLDAEDSGSATLVAKAVVQSASFAESLEEAQSAAAAEVATRALLAVTQTVADRWPPRITADDALIVEIRGYRGWSSVDAIIKGLSGTRGIERVWPRRLGKQGVALAVVTELGRGRVAAALKRVALPGGTLVVKALGERGLSVDIDDAAAGSGSGAGDAR